MAIKDMTIENMAALRTCLSWTRTPKTWPSRTWTTLNVKDLDVVDMSSWVKDISELKTWMPRTWMLMACASPGHCIGIGNVTVEIVTLALQFG